MITTKHRNPRVDPLPGDQLQLPDDDNIIEVEAVAFGTVYFTYKPGGFGSQAVAIWKWRDWLAFAETLPGTKEKSEQDNFWNATCANCGYIRGQHYTANNAEKAGGCPWDERCHQFVEKH